CSSDLVGCLNQTKEYESNNPELNLLSLKQKVADLKQLQSNYLDRYLDLENSKASRSNYIMSNDTGIAYYSKLVKAYLRNQYRGSKTEVKTLSVIKFRSATK
ncbi:MAG: hypothetical protein MH472_01580, partial [Bacteroidia bacterium]|nr:hypothetical protein [Bacteroidia bacterium]